MKGKLPAFLQKKQASMNSDATDVVKDPKKVALPERGIASKLNFKKKRHDKAPGNHLRTAGGNRGMSK